MRREFTTEDLKLRTEVVTEAASTLPVGIGGDEEQPDLVMLSYADFRRLRSANARAFPIGELPDPLRREFMDGLDRLAELPDHD